LTRDHLSFWNRDLRLVVEPGEFRVLVGSNSREVIEAKFEVVER
jgi:beta-glucosidase